jgi:hypothetical protein
MYTFIKTNDPENVFDRSNIEYVVMDEDLTVGDLLGEFQDFLRACGFRFANNETIDVVEEE